MALFDSCHFPTWREDGWGFSQSRTRFVIYLRNISAPFLVVRVRSIWSKPSVASSSRVFPSSYRTSSEKSERMSKVEKPIASSRLTIIYICYRGLIPSQNSELDLLKHLTLNTCPFLKAFLGVRENFTLWGISCNLKRNSTNKHSYLLEQELEWNTVNSAWIILKVNNFNEVSLRSVDFFFGYSLRNYINVIIDAENRVTRHEVSEEFMVMNFIYSYRPSFVLVFELSFLFEGFNEILYVSLFANKNIKGILSRLVALHIITAHSQLTSFVMPSLNHVTFTFFFVSSSARLMSKTS